MTTVSIITPFYNPSHEKVIRSRNSINIQTCKDFEWIQVDDGSDDGGSYEYDIRLDRNYGPSVARNVGFQISSGDIITYLDMGDELNPHRVENLIDLFNKHNIEVLFSAYYIMYPPHDTREKVDHFDVMGVNPHYPTAFEYIQLLKRYNISIPLGVAHTRKPFVLAGGFQRGIVCGEDGILWRRMIDHIGPNRAMFSDDIAGTYIVSSNGQSRTQRRFEMGGFAFDGSRNDNGKYLDEYWFSEYNSKGLYDGMD